MNNTYPLIYKEIIIYPHQIECGKNEHWFAVRWPSILEACVKCRVYKWKWTQYLAGKEKVCIGYVGHWKTKELESKIGE